MRAVGASLGAKTLLHLATLAPSRVSAMVHASATPRFNEATREVVRAAGAPVDMSFGPDVLSKIDARTLIVHGDRDELYPVELAVELYRGIPRARLCVVPTGKHGVAFERASGFERQVLAFFADA